MTNHIQWFGSTIQETWTAIKGTELGAKTPRSPRPPRSDKIHAWGRLFVTAFICAIGTYLVTGDADARAPGMALLGAVAGYWFK